MEKSRPWRYEFNYGKETLSTRLDVCEIDADNLDEKKQDLHRKIRKQHKVTSAFEDGLLESGLESYKDPEYRASSIKDLRKIVPSYLSNLKELVKVTTDFKKSLISPLCKVCNEKDRETRINLLLKLGSETFAEFLDSRRLPRKEREFWENYTQSHSFHTLQED